MARRRILEEPVSRLAVWARRFALFALVAAFLSVIIVRAGMLELIPALSTFAAALGLAGVAILLAFAAFVTIWRQGLAGLGQALAAMAVGGALLAYPAYLAAKAYRLPPINDITTDPTDPPRFDAIARLRPREGANPVAYPGPEVAEKQRIAYPDVEGLDTTIAADAAYATALDVMTKRKWLIINPRPPLAGRRDGTIEAVARTLIMGFRDDIVVRVRATPDGAHIDARSASRYGKIDFGANAARVRSLLSDIDDRLSDLAEKKAAAPAAPAQPPARGAPARR